MVSSVAYTFLSKILIFCICELKRIFFNINVILATSFPPSRNVKMASTQDAWYISLLGLAEHFRTSNPPDIKSCIQCLQAVFNFKPPQRVEARTHLQLGNILLTHTKNIDLARTHLEQSVSFFVVIHELMDVYRVLE